MVPVFNRSSLLDRTLRRKQDLRQSQWALPWALVNVIFAGIVYWDMCQGYIADHFELSDRMVWYCELFLLIVFVLNSVVDVLTYLKPTLWSSAIELTPKQKQLLAVNDSDIGFSVSSSPAVPPPHFPSLTPEQMLSRPSGPAASTPLGLSSLPWTLSLSPSPTLSTANSSRSFYSSSAQHSFSLETNTDSLRRRSLSYLSRTQSSPSSGVLFDEASLVQYLQAHEQKEQRQELVSSESPPTLGASFWSLGHTLLDYSPLLRKYTYQLASRSSQSATSRSDDDPDSPTQHAEEENWNKIGVSSEKLYHWTKNLRQWLNLTIMGRLVSEIGTINDTLRRMGSPDLQIGEVSLSTLRQVSLTKSQLIPTLAMLLPYLDVTPNQEYLVQRITELAAGGCMSAFVWNGGGRFKGKPWADHLPTDSALVTHFLCTYLDARLPPHPNHPDGKTFTNQWFVKDPDKPVLGKESLYIYQAKINPPHYKLIVGEVVSDLAKGRNNLFHTILLFLHHIKTRENGMLGRVNLGLSGINILWILE